MRQNYIDKRIGGNCNETNSLIGFGTRLRNYWLSVFELEVHDDMK